MLYENYLMLLDIAYPAVTPRLDPSDDEETDQ
jgi:hypothetical protein